MIRTGLLALLALTVSVSWAVACPFCSVQGTTLSGEVAQADFIFVGKVEKSSRDPDSVAGGSSIMTVDSILKPHAYINGRKRITLPRYIPLDPKEKNTQFLIFVNTITPSAMLGIAALSSAPILVDPATMTLDAYRGDPLPEKSELGKYLEGAIAVKEKEDIVERLRYFYKYLDHRELVISTDAMMEFGNSDYKDVRKASETFSAETILGWLKDPNTPRSRLGLYGLLIGHCGNMEHAVELKKLVTDPDNAYSSGLDGMMAGFILLNPKDGWEYLLSVAKDRKRDFTVRFSALKVIRFFHDYRQDIIKKEQLVEALNILVDQDDIADLPIEDLRRWKVWDQAKNILKYTTGETHKVSIVRRAILRYSISAAPYSKEAAEYVEKMRKEDPARVKLTEELIRDEELTLKK